MHIVFIVGSYYPFYSAVSKCVANVAEELSKEHKVTVVCLKNNLNESEEEIYNNQKILRTTTLGRIKREKLINQINKTSSSKKNIYKILFSLLKLQQAIKLLVSTTSVNYQLVDAYVNKLSNIDEGIDVIIPACMPFESVLAAYKYKKSVNFKVALIPYLFDQFVENESLHRFKFNRLLKKKKHQKIEKEIVSNSKKVFIMKQLKGYFLENYPNFKDKFQELEHPLVVDYKANNDYYADKNNTTFTYAGSFYKDIRDPKYMLEVFNIILTECVGTLNLYTFGNCESIVNEYARANNSVKANGSIPSNLVKDVLYNSDFLVAVGNSVSNQVPSKIFEYISFGKPIIYFFEIENDSNLDILKKYPYSICIDQKNNSVSYSAHELMKFIESNKGTNTPFGKIAEIFPDALPEYTAKLMERIIIENG